ncbi:hypothetical protein TL16_g05960 [Triparma laevis f. inornata]|uniref:Uncharacterized protein n=1 Tax=Triparma laevis f. inornata TaxID=1714386 RepID=A0A9W7AHY4_9STRA|nr:hypothetical protein TL16_g05960 [Triparma laevis f. inornata]
MLLVSASTWMLLLSLRNSNTLTSIFNVTRYARRSFTFDLNYDSSNPNNLLNFNAGCVDDLPCVPDNLRGVNYGETAEVRN